MPTSVELTGFLQNFLKLGAIDGARAQNAFNRIDGEIDAAWSALQGDSWRSDFARTERQYGRVFDTLAAGAYGLGFDFQRDAFALGVIDVLVGGPTNPNTALQGAFVTFDKELFATGGDLKTFGADIHDLGHVRSASAFAALEAKLSTDVSTLGADYSTLATDVAGVISALPASAPPTVAAATVANPWVGLLSPIQTDFGHLSADFGGGGGAGSVGVAAAATNLGPLGAAFASANTDFLSLDGHIQALAGPLANLLLPAVAPAT